ncbi:MAG: flavin reductase family protein [Pseudomonadota bacterium]
MESNDLAANLKLAMRRLAATVNVISAIDGEGQRHAMTATAVTSLSAEPPSLLICVNKSASIHDVLQAGAGFCINVLFSEHQELSNVCSGSLEGEARFAVGEWDSETGSNMPYLVDAQANLFCDNDDTKIYGSHTIFIGKIRDVKVREAISPLIYVDGAYAELPN